MIIPLGTDSRLRTTPYMNWALIATNVIVFVVFQHLYKIQGHWTINLAATNSLTTSEYDLSSAGNKISAYITYAFLHEGWMHLLPNMLFLYIFGNNVNDKMGQIGYLGFYLAGAVFAGLAYVLMQPGTTPVIGASGAIAAVTGAYLVLFPRSNVTVFYFFFLIGKYEIPGLWFIVIFFAQDIILQGFAGNTGVAHVAHIGGTIFGFLISFLLLWLQLLPRDQFDLVAMVKQWNRRRQYRNMVSKGYNPFTYVPKRGADQPPPPPDPRVEQIMNTRGAILEAVGRHDVPTAAQLYLQLKQLDPQQALPKPAQLDVANQLAGEQLYPQAAEAYETLLRVYPKAEQIEQIELMLGLVYARYLAQYDKARHYLQRAMLRLHDPTALAMAREELAHIATLTPPSSGT